MPAPIRISRAQKNIPSHPMLSGLGLGRFIAAQNRHISAISIRTKWTVGCMSTPYILLARRGPNAKSGAKWNDRQMVSVPREVCRSVEM